MPEYEQCRCNYSYANLSEPKRSFSVSQLFALGTTLASLFQPCKFTASPRTTAVSDPLECEFDGPSNCTTDTINVQSIIAQAEATFQQQQLGNCSNVTCHVRDPGPVALSDGNSCSDVLNITLRMAWWRSENGSNCSANEVSFANCFYDTVSHYQGSNCSDLSGNVYCPRPKYTDFSGHNVTLNITTAWNIYDFQQWSLMYYQAMYDGFFVAGALSQRTRLSKARRIIPIGNQVLGESLLRAAHQSPAFADHLLPVGNLEDATVASDLIEAELATHVKALPTVFQEVAISIPNNLTTFTQWLSSGYFFNEPPAIDTMVTNIVQALNTYVLSQFLQSKNIVVAR